MNKLLLFKKPLNFRCLELLSFIPKLPLPRIAFFAMLPHCFPHLFRFKKPFEIPFQSPDPAFHLLQCERLTNTAVVTMICNKFYNHSTWIFLWERFELTNRLTPFKPIQCCLISFIFHHEMKTDIQWLRAKNDFFVCHPLPPLLRGIIGCHPFYPTFNEQKWTFFTGIISCHPW